jgi:hypothetical protein
MRRRWLRWLLWAVAGIAILAIAAYVVIESSWGRNRALAVLVDRANRALVGELRVEAIHGSVLGDVTLQGVSLTLDGETVFAAEAVRARYSPWELLFGDLGLDTVTVTKPNLRAVESADGWNVAKVLPERDPNAPRSKFEFTIGTVEVVDGTVEVRALDAEPRRIAGLQLVTGFDYDGGHVALDVDRGALRDADTDVAVRELEGLIEIGDAGISVDDVHVVTEASEVAGDVAYLSNGNGERELSFDVERARVALRELAAYVPALRDYPSDTVVEVSGEGTLDDLKADWTLASSSGRGSGHLEGHLQGDTMRLRGSADVADFDPAAWLDNRELRGTVTARGTFDATWPEATPSAIDVRFDVTAPSVSLAGYQASSVRARGTFARGVLDAAASGQAYGASVDGRGTWQQPSQQWTARGRFAQVDLRRLPRELDVPRLATRLSGEGNLSGSRQRFTAEAVLDESTIEDTTVAGDTWVRVEKRGADLAYAGRGAVANLDPARIAAALGDDAPPALRDLVGRINATFDVDARGTTLETLEGKAVVDLANSVLSGVNIEALHATAEVVARRLVADLNVKVQDLTNRAVRLGDQAEFVASGTADAHVDIEDITTPIPLEMIAGRANIALDRAVVRGVTLNRVQLTADVAQGLARIASFQAEGPSLTADITGQLAFVGSSESDLTYAIDVRDLAAFQPLTEQRLAGTAQLDGRVTGPARTPTATGTLSAHELVAGNISTLVTNAKYTVVMPELDAARLRVDATTTATFVEVGETRIDRVQATIGYEGEQLDVNATVEQGPRSVQIAGLIVPHPDHREAHIRQLQLAIANTTWALTPGGEAIVQYGENTLAVRNFELVNGPARLRVDGTLAPGSGIDFTVEGMTVQDVNALLLSERQMTGRIDATGRLTGTLKAPEVTVQLRVTDGRMQEVPYNSLTGNVAYAAQRLSVDVALDAGTNGQLAAKGTLPLALGEKTGPLPPFDLRVDSSSIQVGLLQPLVPQVTKLAGTALVDVRVTGPADAPRIDGTVGIQQTTFEVVETGVTYQQLNADLLLEGQGLTVRQLTVLDGNGREARVEGRLSLPGLSPDRAFNLRLTANEFLVLDNEAGEVAIDAQLQAAGTIAAPKVTGTIEVERGRLEVDTLLDRLVAPGYRPSKVPEIAEAPPPTIGPYANSALQLAVTLPDNVVVRGRGLRTGDTSIGMGDVNLTLGGTLTVSKDPGGEPEVLGRVNVVRGTYDFQGRRFTMVRGSGVQFRGALTNPTLDIRAEREISSVIAQVRVTGSLREPAVTLTSSPPLDEGDILSLIVFNQPMNELGTNERVSLAARAGALAASAIATPIADSVARALDLDVFEIRPSSDISTGGSITIGRQLNDNLFVGFQQQFGTEEASQLSFEYRLTEFLRIMTSFAQGADRSAAMARAEAAGIDLLFVIRR